MIPNAPETNTQVEMPPVNPTRKQITFKVSRLTKPWALPGAESAIRALSGNALDNFDINLKINDKPKMKQSKSKYIRSKASSDHFWRRKFMQVLEAIHDESFHFNLDQWSDYGVSDHERKVILKEFERQQEWRLAASCRVKRDVVESFDNQ